MNIIQFYCVNNTCSVDVSLFQLTVTDDEDENVGYQRLLTNHKHIRLIYF